MAIGMLILRMTVGLTLAAHGAQKLFGWFGGLRSYTGTGQALAAFGFQSWPPARAPRGAGRGDRRNLACVWARHTWLHVGNVTDGCGGGTVIGRTASSSRRTVTSSTSCSASRRGRLRSTVPVHGHSIPGSDGRRAATGGGSRY